MKLYQDSNKGEIICRFTSMQTLNNVVIAAIQCNRKHIEKNELTSLVALAILLFSVLY